MKYIYIYEINYSMYFKYMTHQSIEEALDYYEIMDNLNKLDDSQD